MSSEATVERVLRLLSLLQRRPVWTAVELAEELGITDRSVRRDIERLRNLGYPVQAASGLGGGYKLGAGRQLPPLLLTDEEATATAVSLRIAAGGAISGIGDAALDALAKLDQVMPPRLRGNVRALHDSTATLAGTGEVSIETLTTLAAACRDQVQVRFSYTKFHGIEGQRRTEPVRMVAAGPRWYLMAYDLDRQDWRTFRLDRMQHVAATTFRFRPRDHPDPLDYVQESVTASAYQHLTRVRLHLSAEEARRRIPPQIAKIEEDPAPGRCLFIAGADNMEWMALYLAGLGLEMEILEPEGLREVAMNLAETLRSMAGG
ncbi:YafY family transcriptional regulator [Nesterenkonia sp. MY13]|uniref:YafY family transcriptional regulator n=1 Tax=Nesterenkonia sedimenti TaxID=1463632 RepID=A0A7X8THD6_9MICC|nr:YafY family protein [Nesterenkonia sedimenti]NLS08477.1 YafY family transcriptional regulator [Nesterenkonia sedimenti]